MRGKSAILVLATLILLIQVTSSANVGVSPATLTFKDVLRGGFAERPVMVIIDTEDPVDVTATTRGEIESWITLSEETFSVSKGKAFQLMVSVTPPSDTPNGNYTGFVTVKSSRLSQGQEGHATGLIIPTLDIFVTVQVTDKEVRKCRATGFKVASIEEDDDIVFEVDVLNEGNIRLNPSITFDIWDQDSINIVKQSEYSQTQIKPTQSSHMLIRIPSTGLDLGQYWVDMSAIDCYASQTLTFDVLEEGALRAAGVLERIVVSPWADIDEIVPVAVNFKNTGEKPLEAKFVGKVMFKNKIIQLLESEDPMYVPIDNQTNFQFYFTPRKAGKYIISGRVFYDNKRTYEQSAILNVNPDSNILKSLAKSASYIILITIILALLFKIRNERKNYFKKMRRRHR